MEVGAPTEKRGPGYWRFNNHLLQDSDFIPQMSAHIVNVLAEELDNPTALWEWLEYNIRKFCIDYVTTKNTKRNAHV